MCSCNFSLINLSEWFMIWNVSSKTDDGRSKNLFCNVEKKSFDRCQIWHRIDRIIGSAVVVLLSRLSPSFALLPSKKIIYLSDSAIFLGFHRSLQASFKKSSEVPDLWLSIGLVIVFHRHLSSSKVASNDFSDKNRRSLAQCLKINQKSLIF